MTKCDSKFKVRGDVGVIECLLHAPHPEHYHYAAIPNKDERFWRWTDKMEEPRSEPGSQNESPNDDLPRHAGWRELVRKLRSEQAHEHSNPVTGEWCSYPLWVHARSEQDTDSLCLRCGYIPEILIQWWKENPTRSVQAQQYHAKNENAERQDFTGDACPQCGSPLRNCLVSYVCTNSHVYMQRDLENLVAAQKKNENAESILDASHSVRGAGYHDTVLTLKNEDHATHKETTMSNDREVIGPFCRDCCPIPFCVEQTQIHNHWTDELPEATQDFYARKKTENEKAGTENSSETRTTDKVRGGVENDLDEIIDAYDSAPGIEVAEVEEKSKSAGTGETKLPKVDEEQMKVVAEVMEEAIQEHAQSVRKTKIEISGDGEFSPEEIGVEDVGEAYEKALREREEHIVRVELGHQPPPTTEEISQSLRRQTEELEHRTDHPQSIKKKP